MCEEFIEKYSGMIHKNVWNFVQKNKGYMNTVSYDADDLYQQCMSAALSRFLKSGKSIDEFRLTDFDLRHIMCLYVKQTLPVKTARNTNNYADIMRTIRSQEYDTRRHDVVVDVDTNPDLQIDCDLFSRKLNDVELRVFTMILDGYPHSDIIRQTGMSDMAYRYCRKKIARKMNRYFGQNHLYYGGIA